MKPNSFIVTVTKSENNYNESMSANGKALLQLNDINPCYIRHEKSGLGSFAIFIGERKDSETVDFESPINGSSIIYSASEKKLTVRSDLTGAEPIFWRKNESTVLLSNRLDNLINSDDDPDWESIHCYLSFGYTLKENTFFKCIKQTLPNQKVEIDTEFLTVNAEANSITLGTKNFETLPNNGKIFAKLFSGVMNTYNPMALMISAGWDSRALLAPKKTPIKIVYTHGDISSRECSIAQKLSGALRIDHYFRDVKGMIINTQLLEEMLELHGHCLWPIWHLSSKFISENFHLPITSGVIGARMGGHNGFLSIGTRLQKSINSLHLINSRLVTKEKIIKDFKKSLSAPRAFWFTSDKGAQIFSQTCDTVTGNINTTLDHYLKETDNFSFAIESFNYDHVSRQYMMKQPGMAKPFHGYYSPLSHPKLLHLIYTIPFSQRFQNRLTRQVVTELNSELLEFPMAATLAKAKRPIFIQEISRVFRILYEIAFLKLKKTRPTLGWFNYEHLYSGDFFETTIKSLKSDIWSKERMLKKTASNKINNIDAGSTMDMVCKIKTIDYYLLLVNKAAEGENGVHNESS